MEPVVVAVVGAGYWGPNLVRNFHAFPGTRVRWVCDVSLDRARGVAARWGGVGSTDDLDEVLADESVEAVAIATPPDTHAEIGLACLEGGRHVLVEKPLATSVAAGRKLIDIARERGLVVMSDHTYCYTPSVGKIRDLIATGALGDVQYVDSVRINLGLVQTHVDVFWDLAAHDLAIFDFVLPAASSPVAVAAHAADPLGVGHSCIGYLTLPLRGGGIAHVHVNWLSPTKIRTTIIGGSKRMVVWDDLQPAQRLTMYDKGIEMVAPLQGDKRTQALVSYRTGDMIAPALPEAEALQGVVQEFATAIREGRPPLTDGEAGLRVLRTLEAAHRSLELGGAFVSIADE